MWREYKENKAHMMQLIDETETELNKVIPKTSHAAIQTELKTKQQLRAELEAATGDILAKMRELADTLNSVAGDEQQAALESEVKNELIYSFEDILNRSQKW